MSRQELSAEDARAAAAWMLGMEPEHLGVTYREGLSGPGWYAESDGPFADDGAVHIGSVDVALHQAAIRVAPEPEPRLLFLDLETTGFDAVKHHIVEVGAILVGPDLAEIGRWHRLLPYPALAWVAEDVVELHRASGLLEDTLDEGVFAGVARSRQALERIERELLSWLVLEHDVAPRSLELAGYSIHFDRSFISAQMPRLHGWLSHRMIDVSTIRQLDRRWRPPTGERAGDDGRVHRAIADCEHAIGELRRYRAELWRLP